MTREETVKIIRIMVDSYPNYKPNNISETVDVWHMMLSEYTYEQEDLYEKCHEHCYLPYRVLVMDELAKATLMEEGIDEDLLDD